MIVTSFFYFCLVSCRVSCEKGKSHFSLKLFSRKNAKLCEKSCKIQTKMFAFLFVRGNQFLLALSEFEIIYAETN